MPRRSRLPSLVAAALLASGLAAPAAPLRGQATAFAPAAPAAFSQSAFDVYVAGALRDWQVPGVAVAIVKNDSIVLLRGYGVRRLGGRDSVDARTVFGIASNTKAMTAACLAILVDEGKLNWDDRVVDVLPWFRVADPWVTREFRIRDLVSHRSGLPPYGGDISLWASSQGRREHLDHVRFVQPVTSFRSEYAYQNSFFLAAGEVVEAVSGQRWDDFLRDHIFEPLGMTGTTTEFRTLAQGADVATPHIRLDGRTQPIAPRNIENIGAAAAVNSTAEDMAKWVRLQLGRGASHGVRLFSENASRAMWSQVTPRRLAADSAQTQPAASFASYGLGWSIRDYRGRKMVEHGGWTDGMISHVAMLPHERLGVVVLTNIHNRDLTAALIERVFDAYLGVPATDWSAYHLARTQAAERELTAAESQLRQERVAGTRPSLPLAAYAGIYRNDVYGDVRIDLANGALAIRMLESPTFVGTLEHWQYDVFRPRWRDPVLESHLMPFTLDEHGRPASFQINVGEFIEPNTYTFTRAPGRGAAAR